MPLRKFFVNVLKERGTDSKEMAEIFDIPKELDNNKRKTETFYDNIPTTLEKTSGLKKRFKQYPF